MRLDLNRIVKKYGERTVLDIDSINFTEGKLYAVLGPNGSGKTTMLRLIAGIEKPDSGEILYNGSKTIARSDISYMPQKPYMFDMSVLNNLFLGMGQNKNRSREAEDALERVAMKGFMKARVYSLSGGETQRVALARVLALHRKLVLLDEPASAADISSSRLIEHYIRSTCNNDGSTIIFTTHSPSQALRIADELIFLCDGKVIERGDPHTVLNSPRSSYVREFLQNWRI